jgi:hypothetical protein
MRRLLLACSLAASSSVVSAQIHPCDQAAPASQTIQSGSPYRLQFCSPIADGIEAIVGYVDNLAFDLVPVVVVTGPNASGLAWYESAPFIQVARGSHVLSARVYNRNGLTGLLQLGPVSSPFSFSAVDDTPVPAAAVIKGVVR